MTPRLINYFVRLGGLLLAFISSFFISIAWFTISATTIPSIATAQAANFHPCNAQPALPICRHGYGKRIAVRRWNAKPAALDPDALSKAALTTENPAKELDHLKASSILVQDIDNGDVLFERDSDEARPIASITKLMTALVILDADLDLNESIQIDASDHQLNSEIPSRLATGTKWTRNDLLKMALAASENSAAHALGRTYPDGLSAFVKAMNNKAKELGMTNSSFVEPTGLSNDNIANANDLVKLLIAASNQPLISTYTTSAKHDIDGAIFNNTNMLVGRPQWDILLSKTGSTRQAGDCLLMLIRLHDRNLAVVLLNANGANGVRFGDAVRVRRIVNSQLAAK